jgi:hypothetical protein
MKSVVKHNLWIAAGIVFLSLGSRESHAVVRVGNGGDVVYCSESSTENRFSGYYSYDFLATYNLSNANSDVVQVGSLEASLARVSQVLGRILPERQVEFDEFVRNRNNFSDRKAPRIWLSRPGELIDVQNLPHVRSLPANCRQVYQAVIRYELGEQIAYEVNPKMLASLEPHPLQMSFLLVHEFLWEIYPRLPDDGMAAQNRFELTRFLHSQAALEWSPTEVWSYVMGLGGVPSDELFKNYLSWADKYNPPSTVAYRCKGEDYVGTQYDFILEFSDLNYLGSSQGYFYSDVRFIDPRTFQETKLLTRPVDTQGLYVFEGGFNVSLQSQNPLDGSFENNMSEVMRFRRPRGGGECNRL